MPFRAQGLTWGLAYYACAGAKSPVSCTALTGVEAISNGVPAFRKPKSQNAATTLLLMGMISVTMMLSMVALATWTGVKYAEDPATQLARDVFRAAHRALVN